MILAPHQDDELILCGTFLKKMIENQNDVYVVFLTNGDYTEEIGYVRMQEAIEVLQLYGLPENHIIFMGYANEYEMDDVHIYNATSNKTVYSQYGNEYTYGLPEHPEFCFYKYGIHHKYQRENIVNDLYEIVKLLLPDIIFATDYEIHPDHKANSLLLDEIMGRMLKETDDYIPIIYKKPGYSVGWFGESDYNEVNNPSTKKRVEKTYVNEIETEFCNPYIRWIDRVRIPIDEYCRTSIREDNILYQALKLYKSQKAVEHFDMLCNGDNVFWQRRTDSLTYKATIRTTSGEAKFLNDFKIVDSEDIRRQAINKWKLDASVWKPESWDKQPCITIEFEKEKAVSEIVIYQEFLSKASIVKSILRFDDKDVMEVKSLYRRKPTRIQFESRKVKKIEYQILECSNDVHIPGITEIEVFSPREKKLEYIKMLINDQFVYDDICMDKLTGNFEVYEIYDDGSAYKSRNIQNYDIEIKNDKEERLIPEKYIRNGHFIGEIEGNFVSILLKRKGNAEVQDSIYIYKRSSYMMDSILPDTYKQYIRILDSISDKREKMNYIYQAFYKSKALNRKKEQYFLKLLYYAAMKQSDEVYKKDLAKVFLLTDERRLEFKKYINDYLKATIYEVGKKKEKDYRARIFFIGTPDHYNIGDHAISYATLKMLRDIFPNRAITEVCMRDFAQKLPYLKKYIKSQDLIILQGGGNMGNIYWRNERIRREVIENFSQNRIIIFPETIFYEKNSIGDSDFEISKLIYKKAKKLTICARERKSYEIIKEAYPNAEVLLTPDIVCYLSVQTDVIRDRIRLVVRKDLEKSVQDDVLEEIRSVLDKKEIPYEFTDMMRISKGYIGKANRNIVVEKKIAEIASSSLVITDRLHAMILSAITGTPCLVITNYNHKIRSTYQTWFHNLEYIKISKGKEFVESEINSLLENSKGEFCNANLFNELINVLKEVFK